MLKRKALRNFNCLLFLSSLLILLTTSLFAQQASKKDSCYLLVEGKVIPLFSPIPAIKKTILISRDIENLNKSVFLYWYDERPKSVNKFIVTPQVLFQVDTAKLKTNQQTLSFNFVHRIKDGNISDKDLQSLLIWIKAHYLPFLQLPNQPTFKSSYRGTYKCSLSKVTISSVKDLGAVKKEFDIAITLSR